MGGSSLGDNAGSVLSDNQQPEDLSVAIIMEAFAVQAIACQQGAGIPKNIVNPMGGALARGHPIGASGALIAVDLIRALDTKPGYGLAAIAAAGGVGSALILRSDPAPI
ncbi:hypothetical protein [Sedimentitalea nanhaiensis]|uniref:hypothetical protein n=1 Tax=Sedimentitalea nanhaiensis TaxID=999627 RepID=UPI00349E7367